MQFPVFMMAQRQFVCSTYRQVCSYLHLPKHASQIQTAKNGSSLLIYNAVKAGAPCFPKKEFSLVGTSFSSINQASEKNNTFIDLFTNNPYKRLYMPTLSINKLKVYEDITLPKSIQDPLINNIKIIDAPVPGKPEKKEAVRMILIRRRKMRRHKLKKFRKRMKFVLAKIKLKRELRKEQAFRTELLSQIEVADNFDSKVYVENIINTIKNQPVPETLAEFRSRYRELKKMNRYKTNFIRPIFDD